MLKIRYRPICRINHFIHFFKLSFYRSCLKNIACQILFGRNIIILPLNVRTCVHYRPSPVGTQRCDNVVTTSQIGCDVIQPKPDLHTTLIDVDNFIGCVPTDILRCIDVEIKSLVFII